MTRNIWQQLARYQAHEMSEEESTLFEEEIKQHHDQQELQKDIRQIWELSNKQSDDIDWETEKEWLNLETSLQDNTRVIEFKPGYKQHYWQAAAMIVVLLTAGYLWYSYSPQSDNINHMAQNKVAPFTIAADNAVKEIYLPDSSRIWLNQNSSLSYSADFGKTERRITLTGEGFFIITKDKEKPFIIQAGETETKVVGTSFDLKAYPEQTNVELTVVTGKVEFSSVEGKQKKSLTPKQKVVFDKDKTTIRESIVTNTDFLKWVKQNNAEYLKEAQSPKQYITHSFNWRKNGIGATIIEGKLISHASMATYKNVQLTYKIYTKKGTEKPTRTYTVYEQLTPGQTKPYKYNLGNIFTNTARVTIEIKDAAIIP